MHSVKMLYLHQQTSKTDDIYGFSIIIEDKLDVVYVV